MSEFPILDEHAAPPAARDALQREREANGDIPNLYGILAANPAALEAYLSLSRIFESAGFTPLERQVVLIAASVENACHFCVAAQTAAASEEGLDMSVIEAVRESRPVADARLEALRQFTRLVVIQRGFVSDTDVERFIRAGWDRPAVLGVILGVSLKVISNYTNHVAETPLNKAYKPFAWTPRARRSGDCQA
ncbi:carboxymuconolactone decarboxylase family protein [Hyphomonas johnsonii]|jgi:AhpD family alkylhydroperoxidase|uniref:Carboxymuconolactone decarboxylase n=1 Tax=Hyphomonas johnsonii MHS-2 TaxID=1280950 RepID=A0A059FR07_9PROT|nr:carboxymuconolactone decarboxylase family protein [Hyphomonas johnsonii]KCZ92908.1 carboxymuconolactone decarboxylase [Hyphomonas johnsonii MHS-2]